MSAYKSTVPANDPLAAAGDRSLLLSLTSAWPGAAGRRISAAHLDAIDAGIKGFSNLIETPPSGLTVTLTSRSADLPLSFNNKTGRPVRVQIRFESDKLEFPSGAAGGGGCLRHRPGCGTLPPRTTIRFPVVTGPPGRSR